MSEIDDLIRRAERFHRTGEHLSAVFARELAAVLRDAERQLVRLLERSEVGAADDALRLVRALAMRDQLRAILRQAGYDRLIAAATSAGAEAFIQQAISEVTREAATALLPNAGPMLDALRRIAAVDLLGQGDEAAIALWRALSTRLLTAQPIDEILAGLADALDKSEAQIRSLFDTLMTMYGRQVEAQATEDLGQAQPFLFVGPVDDVTREWCLNRVGRVFTRAAIDTMDNGQIPNVFLSGGGWNCRHSWIAVESEALREMAESGERVPEIADEVARIRQRKAEQQAAKKRKAA